MNEPQRLCAEIQLCNAAGACVGACTPPSGAAGRATSRGPTPAQRVRRPPNGRAVSRPPSARPTIGGGVRGKRTEGG
eukprot:1205590-Alexandrium_andersonii.AAC.1